MPKPLCATAVNAALVCETSETMKWHQKVLVKGNRWAASWELSFLMQESVALMPLERKDLTNYFLCPSLKPLHCPLHRAVLSGFAVARPTTHSPSWRSDLVKKGREVLSQGVDDIRHKNGSYRLGCTESTKSRATEALICFLIIFGEDVFATWRPL